VLITYGDEKLTTHILENAAALPAAPDEEDATRYPLLGYLTWYSLRDVRISRHDLKQLYELNGLPLTELPAEISPSNAFRKATSAINTEYSNYPKPIGDGKFEVLMVRNVLNNTTEIIRQIVKEVRDSENKSLDYQKIGEIRFDRKQLEVFASISPQYQAIGQQVLDTFDEFCKYYDGKAVRERIYAMISATLPVSVRPAGGVYFISNEHKDLIESIEGLVRDINKFATTAGTDAVFESVPMLDLEKQRMMIFDKYESQTIYSVDHTLDELADILRAPETPTKAVVAKYIKRMQDIKDGILKYEDLLEKDMSTAKLKADLLNQQVSALLNKASISTVQGTA
jgi:hypothetical protein